MVRRGWVETTTDPSDGRRTLVFVPDEVRRQAEQFQALSEARALDHLLAELPPDRRKSIVDALEELLELLRREAAENRPGPSGALHRGLSAATDRSSPSAPPRDG